MAPISVMRTEMTAAKIGRSTKKCVNRMARCSAAGCVAGAQLAGAGAGSASTLPSFGVTIVPGRARSRPPMTNRSSGLRPSAHDPQAARLGRARADHPGLDLVVRADHHDAACATGR